MTLLQNWKKALPYLNTTLLHKYCLCFHSQRIDLQIVLSVQKQIHCNLGFGYGEAEEGSSPWNMQ
jgi:hypothetical protein